MMSGVFGGVVRVIFRAAPSALRSRSTLRPASQAQALVWSQLGPVGVALTAGNARRGFHSTFAGFQAGGEDDALHSRSGNRAPAAHTHGQRHSELQELFERGNPGELLQYIRENINTMNGRDVASSLICVQDMHRLSRGERGAEGASSEDMGMCIDMVSLLDSRATAILRTCLLPGAVAKSDGAIFYAREVSTTLLSLGRMGIKPSGDLLSLMTQHAILSADKYTPRAISSVLWAHVTLKLPEDPRVWDALLGSARAWIMSDQGFDIATAERLLNAMVRRRTRGSEQDESLALALVDLLVGGILSKQMPVGNVASILLSISKMRPPQPAFDTLVKNVSSIVQVLRDEMLKGGEDPVQYKTVLSPRDALTLILAFGRLIEQRRLTTSACRDLAMISMGVADQALQRANRFVMLEQLHAAAALNRCLTPDWNSLLLNMVYNHSHQLNYTASVRALECCLKLPKRDAAVEKALFIRIFDTIDTQTYYQLVDFTRLLRAIGLNRRNLPANILGKILEKTALFLMGIAVEKQQSPAEFKTSELVSVYNAYSKTGLGGGGVSLHIGAIPRWSGKIAETLEGYLAQRVSTLRLGKDLAMLLKASTAVHQPSPAFVGQLVDKADSWFDEGGVAVYGPQDLTTSVLALAKLSKMGGDALDGKRRDKVWGTIAKLEGAAVSRIGSFKGGDFADLFESFAILQSSPGGVVAKVCDFFGTAGAGKHADLRTKTAVRMVTSIGEICGVEGLRPLLDEPLDVLKDMLTQVIESEGRNSGGQSGSTAPPFRRIEAQNLLDAMNKLDAVPGAAPFPRVVREYVEGLLGVEETAAASWHPNQVG